MAVLITMHYQLAKVKVHLDHNVINDLSSLLFCLFPVQFLLFRVHSVVQCVLKDFVNRKDLAAIIHGIYFKIYLE